MDARADELLARIARGRVLWLMHVNADPDCVASAFALQHTWGGTVGAADGMSRAGARLAARIGLDVDTFPHPENHDVVVAVDTSSRSQLGRLGPRAGAALLVDHHRYGDMLADAPAAAWDPDRASCAEVVLALLDRAGRTLDAPVAFALLAGLVSDTARFRHADEAAFAAATRLLPASGASMEKVLDALEGEADEDDGDDLSRRNATLLAATRARVETVGGHLLAQSEVGSFDAAAALALVRAGADVALVAQERSATARISMRASEAARAAGVHLGEIANEAAREVGWSGGGHEGAAGLSGKPPVATAREAALKRLRAKLEAR